MTAYQESKLAEAEPEFGVPFRVSSYSASPEVLIVCEHASNHIPDTLNQLGLPASVAESHVAWDPGAIGVAQEMAQAFASVLVEGTVSRLVYDCNRPPDAASAIPEKSEVFDIPGNRGLDRRAKDARVQSIYLPFHQAVADQVKAHHQTLKLLVTVHSFTPVFYGVARDVEIGILHGRDDRFAQRMMAAVPVAGTFDVRLNEPYAASDGVAHTLDTHGAANGMANVMIEIRNDIIETKGQQSAIAGYLSAWINDTLDHLSQELRQR